MKFVCCFQGLHDVSEIIIRETLEKQVAVVENNQAMAKWTLRELCLEAVVSNMEHFNKVSLTSQLVNLRKEHLVAFCVYIDRNKINYVA
jgi:hypothetical protein